MILVLLYEVNVMVLAKSNTHVRCECSNMQDPQFYTLGFVMLDY